MSPVPQFAVIEQTDIDIEVFFKLEIVKILVEQLVNRRSTLEFTTWTNLLVITNNYYFFA